jgi:hypothetical protein
LPPAARNPFEKGFLDFPKLFNWIGLDTVFFFVSLRVTSWLKIDGGFWLGHGLDKKSFLVYKCILKAIFPPKGKSFTMTAFKVKRSNLKEIHDER